MTDEDHLSARFKIVYRQHERHLFARASLASGRGLSPQDLLQTACLKAWEWFLNFPSAADEHLRAMLFQFINWTATDEGRRRQRSPIVPIERPPDDEDDLFEKVADDSALPDEVANRNDLAALISAALERLDNADMRTVLELRYTDPEPSLQEIAERMRISVGNVKKLHQRAKEALEADHKLMTLAKEMNISTEVQLHEF